MFGRANGLVFGLLLFITSLLGSVFLLFPFVPLAYFWPQIWRLVADRLIGYWLTFPASMIFFLFDVKVRVTGDLIHRDKPALIIMNHRTRLDWLFFWNALYRMDPWLLTTEKISLKAGLKQIPGAGWAMGCGNYIFLNRNYAQDQKVLENTLKYYKDIGSNYQLLLFPEGTDRGERAVRISHKYAEDNKVDRFDYVLHPRTTGFNFILNQMIKNDYISHIYDVTVGYPKGIISSEQELLKEGRFPGEVHFDVKRYTLEEVAGEFDKSKEVTATEWLKNKWIQKEKKLDKFYNESGEFTPEEGDAALWPVSTFSFGYYFAFFAWTFFAFFWIYWIYQSFYIKIYCLAAVGFYSWALKARGGIEFLIMEWYYRCRIF